jgi:hypothetical protein
VEEETEEEEEKSAGVFEPELKESLLRNSLIN